MTQPWNHAVISCIPSPHTFKCPLRKEKCLWVNRIGNWFWTRPFCFIVPYVKRGALIKGIPIYLYNLCQIYRLPQYHYSITRHGITNFDYRINFNNIRCCLNARFGGTLSKIPRPLKMSSLSKLLTDLSFLIDMLDVN